MNPLILKLEQAGVLDEQDRAILRDVSTPSRKVGAGSDLSREGDRPETVHLVMEGLACRYKILPGGKRQIVALLVPGDFCDMHVAILGARDHSIATLSPCTIVEIPRATTLSLIAGSPRILHALWWANLVDESILRAWLASMGQRAASQRMAHLFCELLVRLQAVNRATGNGYALPMTQIDLGDLLGFTSVHANRTLKELREQDLSILRGGHLDIPDVPGLKAFCGFDPNYLHQRPRRPDL